MMTFLIAVLEWFVAAYFITQVGYLLLFSLAASLNKKPVFQQAKTLHLIRIIIPAYKEDSVILSTVYTVFKQTYPTELFDVVVVADSFAENTLNGLKAMPIRLIEVAFEKSTKGKALQTAIAVTQNNPADIVVILDADNHMAENFLQMVNNAFTQGYKAAQGHRTAKRRNSSFALLDACAEEINNHIFRRGHVALGLPSALIGSGMAFDWKEFVRIISHIGETFGEDKEIEFQLARTRQKVAFLDGVYVYDEKVATKAVFAKQRSRWLAMQLEYFQEYFLEGWFQLLRGNVAFFNKSFQTCILPRVMLVAMLCLWTLISAILLPKFVLLNTVLLIALLVSLFLGIPRSWYNRELLGAFRQIPGAVTGILKSTLQIGMARKSFFHTPHGENLS